jgi:hypothetical protein
MHLNNNKKKKVIAAAVLTMLATIVVIVSSISTTPVAATTASNTTTTASSSGIGLSPQPVYQERVGTVSETPINQTHFQLTISGNGTLTLPNGPETNEEYFCYNCTINTTSTGSITVSLEGTGVGKELLSTEDGTDTATATFYEIARFNMEDGTGKGLIIALVHTNSTTGKLAPLDGMILAGQQEFTPEPTSSITLWEWQSGIPLPTATTTQAPPLMNTTTTMTNAASASDTNATTATGEESVVEEAVGGAEVAE